MRPTLRQLEALKCVADTGSMTRSAAELGISQPAVSRLLSDLSAMLGLRLFDRRNGRLVPTQETRFLLPELERLSQTLDQIAEISRNLNLRTAGHIKIACLPGFATSHLPGLIADFLHGRPGVTATIEPDRPERIMEWIIGEQYDCAITDGFEGHPAVFSEIVPIRTVCIFPQGHPFEALEEVRPAHLSGEQLIHARRDSPFFRDLNEVFTRYGIGPTYRVETRQFTAACELVARGVGVSVISELDASQYTGRGVVFRPFRPRIPHKIALIRPIHKNPSMITLEFMELFRESLRPLE